MKFNSVYEKMSDIHKKDSNNNDKNYNEKNNLSTNEENSSPIINKRFPKNENTISMKVLFDNKLEKKSHIRIKSVNLD